jgi:glycerophosphoryl diester phosphodiesterase
MPFKEIRFGLLTIIGLLMLLFIQCKKKEVYSDDSYFGHKVIVLGHRGMGMMYRMPGNTYEAIYPVKEIGADGAEVDVQLTRDSVLILFHEHLLSERTACSGRVYEQDWAEIKQCKYFALGNNIFINSIDELFSHLTDLQNWYFAFDCSNLDNDVADPELYRNQYVRAIKRLCDKYGMSDRVFIEGEKDLLLKAQQLGLTNKLFYNAGLTASEIDFAAANHFFGFSTSKEWLYDNVDLAHQKGLYVMLWSPNDDKENKDALKLKADIVQTDDPIDMLRYLNRFNYDYIIP